MCTHYVTDISKNINLEKQITETISNKIIPKIKKKFQKFYEKVKKNNK